MDAVSSFSPENKKYRRYLPEAEIISIVDTAKEMVSLGMLLQTMIQGIPLDPLGMPLQTTGEMGLTMFNDAKAAISMGKMDGLLRRVRHLELRVKYCQHLYRRRQLSLTHWRGDENPADGLTKSLRPLNLWTNLVDAVGLVPGPNEKGQNWIKNFLNQIQKEEELKELAQFECGSERAIQEGELSVTHQLCMSHTFFACHLSFSHLFRLS